MAWSYSEKGNHNIEISGSQVFERTMKISRYDEAEGGENKRRKLVNTFSATESISVPKLEYIVP